MMETIQTKTYLLCLIMGVLGILFHLFVFKIPAVKKRAKAAGVPFSIWAYLNEDFPAVIASFIAVFAVLIGLDEVVKLKPAVMDIVKWFFFFIGYNGSSILINALGKFDKSINASNQDKIKTT